MKISQLMKITAATVRQFHATFYYYVVIYCPAAY
jgi:hypothetical protein